MFAGERGADSKKTDGDGKGKIKKQEKDGQGATIVVKPEFDRKRIEKSLESTPGGERSRALFNGSGHL